jgi:hypothetical protein
MARTEIDSSLTEAKFYDRGDPADNDYTQASLTLDGAWNDLDLSSIVPAGATAVKMYVYITHANPYTFLSFRKNGNTNGKNICSVITHVAGQPNIRDIIVPCDSNRVIEYNATAGSTIIIVVQGWWK